MTREKYESLPLATLKELSKARKMKGVSTLKKAVKAIKPMRGHC